MKTFDSGFSLYIQWFERISVFTKRVKSTSRSIHVSKKASFVLYFQRPSKKGRTNDVKEYNTKPAAGVQKIETLGGDYALKWDDETQMSVEERRQRIIAHAFRTYGTIRRLCPPDIGGQMTMPLT